MNNQGQQQGQQPQGQQGQQQGQQQQGQQQQGQQGQQQQVQFQVPPQVNVVQNQPAIVMKSLSKWGMVGLDLSDAGFSKLHSKESKYSESKAKYNLEPEKFEIKPEEVKNEIRSKSVV